MNKPDMVRILDVRDENPVTKTFVLSRDIKADPGQFIMLWIPRSDEKPFALSKIGGNAEVTVKKVGPFTEKLFELTAGDHVGVRGPYGRGFTLTGKKMCFVAGGIGIAPLMPLIERAAEEKNIIDVVVGAKTKDELTFTGRLMKLKANPKVVTDDGTMGGKKYATDALDELLGKKRFDVIYSCGPEPMMKKVLDMAGEKKIPTQFNVERYMKCGIGLCDQCSLDGLLVCRDGPVFSGKELLGTEFGVHKRDACGIKVEV